MSTNDRSAAGGRPGAGSGSAFYLLHALSPVHMGTGAALGGIDLPHSREAVSGLPNAPGSGIKGVLRDVLRRDGLDGPVHTRLFGARWREGDESNRDQGALIFSDALLACLPVASYAGGFAWVTSPLCLRRMEREMKACGVGGLGMAVPVPGKPEKVGCVNGSPLAVGGHVYLHDIRLEADPGLAQATMAVAKRLAGLLFPGEEPERKSEREFFETHVLVVDEAVLAYLSVAAMDVRTRIAMNDDSKTVRDGGLWVEESLPAETILWGSMAADPMLDRDGRHPAEASIRALRDACGATRRLQIGGKATVGRGVVQLRFGGRP